MNPWKIKVKFEKCVPFADHESLWGRGSRAPLILKFGTRWSGQCHAPVAVSQEKEPRLPIDLEAGLASELVWTVWGRENIFFPEGDRTTIIPVSIF
jgi:hypothetical protein